MFAVLNDNSNIVAYVLLTINMGFFINLFAYVLSHPVLQDKLFNLNNCIMYIQSVKNINIKHSKINK